MTKTDDTTLILKYDLSSPREADKITETAKINPWTGEKEDSKEERKRLEEESRQRRLQWDRKLSISCLTQAQVVKLLNTTPQTLQERVKNQSLLAISYQGSLIFPQWQFDPNNPNGLVEGLPQVLEALEISARGKISWLTKPNPVFQQQAPIEALQQGEKDRVLQKARWVGIL